MVKLRKSAALFGILVGISGCTLNGSKQFHSASVHSVGSDEPSSLCANFSLTNDQATQLLNRAKPITPQQLHDHYNYLPCYVKGTVIRSGEGTMSCDYTIRAGGTAELVCDDGQGYIYACDTCEVLLPVTAAAT